VKGRRIQMSRYEFDALIEESRGGGAAVRIPQDVQRAFGRECRVKVKVSFDGHAYRGSVAPYEGVHILGVAQAILARIGKSIGDSVHIVLKKDTKPWVVDRAARSLAVGSE
jgi:hypothetical protein